MLTMLLGGIWHGAGWKFVAWGALHGGGLALERMIEPWLGRYSQRPAARVVATIIVFHFVCLAWIFFRAEDFAVARLYLAGFADGWSGGLQHAAPFMMLVIALGMAGHFTPPALFERAAAALGPVPAWWLGLTALIAL